MIVSLKDGADPAAVLRALVARGLWVSQVERGAAAAPAALRDRAALGGRQPGRARAPSTASSAVTTAASPFPLVERAGARRSSVARRATIGAPGAPRPVLMCGPCSVESEEQVRADRRAPRAARRGVPARRRVQAAHLALRLPGARRARAPLDAPRGRRARDAGRHRGARRGRRADRVAEHADLVQVGSRNMHNYALLKAIGRTGGRRCSSAAWRRRSTSGSWPASTCSRPAPPAVVFCERGIRGFDDATRNLLDLGAVALLAHVHRLPVIVDPSHGAGRRDLVLPARPRRARRRRRRAHDRDPRRPGPRAQRRPAGRPARRASRRCSRDLVGGAS